jgi:hypothetical protein
VGGDAWSLHAVVRLEADSAEGPTWSACVVGTKRGLSNRSLTEGRADYGGEPRSAPISRVR